MSNQEGNPTIGQEVTIWPRLGPGESRDTEGGAQPWKTTCVGFIDDRIIIKYSDGTGGYPEFQAVERELVQWKKVEPFVDER